MSAADSTQRQIAFRSRPIRVAYLVELSEDSHSILDAIFHASKRYWGGRFSLVVPCESGVVCEAYREWLRAYDPDIIYSYVDLSADVRLNIHETIYPAYLTRHRTWRDEDISDARRYRPSLPVEPLSTSTLVPILSRRSDLGGERALRIVNAAGQFSGSRFITDNFGVELGGLDTDIQGRLSDFGSLWTIDDRQPDPRMVRSRAEKVFSSVEELLIALGRERRATTPMRLAAALTPRLECREARWSHSFNLLVGDTIVDRIVYWNSRFSYPLWRDGDQVDLRLSTELAGDSNFLESLANFLASLPPVSGNNSGGTPIVTIRSSSLTSDQLETIKTALGQPKSWVHYRVERFESVDDCVPSLDQRWRSGGFVPMRGLSTGTWHRASVARELTVLQPEPPEHLRHCPVTLQSVHEGLWAVDLDIERTVDYSRHANTTDTWRLPRRLRATGAFTRPYQVGLPNGQFIPPRTALGGFLTLFTGGRSPLPQLTEPSDEEAITHALVAGRDWWPFLERDEEHPPQLCYAAERSNAGRYFWGSLQLLGGLHQANEFLLHRFWREQLARFGATDQRPEQRLSEIRTRLKRRLPEGPFNLEDEANLDRLSDIVAQEADAIRLAVQSIPWTKLQEDHEDFVQAESAAHPPRSGVDPEKWQNWDRNSLSDAVRSLCVRGVLHQGVEHTCPRCHHVTWVAIGGLDRTINCEICGRTEAAPVNEAWEFRLHGFLRDALRSHGVGPLFWALDRISDANTSSFWFEGPLNIYLTRDEDERRRVATDIDLTIVRDGIVRMCEVKQSARQLKRVEALAEIMMRLRPDIATIAIMEPSTKRIEATFDRFATSLKGSGIEAELLTFEPDRDLRDRAFLGALRSVRLL